MQCDNNQCVRTNYCYINWYFDTQKQADKIKEKKLYFYTKFICFPSDECMQMTQILWTHKTRRELRLISQMVTFLSNDFLNEAEHN